MTDARESLFDHPSPSDLIVEAQLPSGYSETDADDLLPCGHPKSDETSADGYTFCAVCAVTKG